MKPVLPEPVSPTTPSCSPCSQLAEGPECVSAEREEWAGEGKKGRWLPEVSPED